MSSSHSLDGAWTCSRRVSVGHTGRFHNSLVTPNGDDRGPPSAWPVTVRTSMCRQHATLAGSESRHVLPSGFVRASSTLPPGANLYALPSGWMVAASRFEVAGHLLPDGVGWELSTGLACWGGVVTRSFSRGGVDSSHLPHEFGWFRMSTLYGTPTA